MPRTEIKQQKLVKSVSKRTGVVGLAMFTAVLTLAGCRQDMHNQPKFVPQRGTDFYADGRSARPQVVETVARSQMHQDVYFFTGMVDGVEGTSFPMPVTREVLARGQERYNVFCTPCHSRVGNGVGMIVQRGYRPAGNFHTERLRNAPLGHFYSVIANGYGAMPDYAAQLAPEDRWAVVAYIKALQLSQNATQADAKSQQVQTLADITEKDGLPPGFALDWPLPDTAKVIGTPDGQDNGIPRQYGPMGTSTSPAAHGMSQTTARPAVSQPMAPTGPASSAVASPVKNHRP